MHTTTEIIARMGDRISDEELGLQDGTLELAAERIIEMGIDPDDLTDSAWQTLVGWAIDAATRAMETI